MRKTIGHKFFMEVALGPGNNGRDHPVAAKDLPLSKRVAPRLGCIGWFPVRSYHRSDIHQFTANAEATEHAIIVSTTE